MMSKTVGSSLISIFLLFVSMTFVAFPENVIADDRQLKRHSLSFEWSRDKQTFSAYQKTQKIEPKTGLVQYAYQLNENWYIESAYWKGDEALQSTKRLSLEKNLSGLNIGVNYVFPESEWWWALGLQTSHDDTRLNLEGASGDIFEEQLSSKELFFTFGNEYAWQHFSLAPSFSLAYQRSESETRKDILVNSIRVRDIQVQSDHGAYASTSLAASYLSDTINGILLSPSLSIGWTEAILGDVVNTRRLEAKSNRVYESPSQQQELNDTSGSGFISVSLMLIVSDYYSSISYIESLGLELDSSSLSLQIGLDF